MFDERFPASPASALLRGQVLLALEEFDAAVAAFDVVLSADPDQPEALLHRMRAVSQLGDAARGEAAADRLVTLGTWYQGEAYYWRAWNRRVLRPLDQAASDIDTASASCSTPPCPNWRASSRSIASNSSWRFRSCRPRASATATTARCLRDRASPRTTRALGRRRRVVYGNHRMHTRRPGCFAHPDGRNRARRWIRRVAPGFRPVPSATAPQRTAARGLPRSTPQRGERLAGDADQARPLAVRALAWDSGRGVRKSCSTGSRRAGTKVPAYVTPLRPLRV